MVRRLTVMVGLLALLGGISAQAATAAAPGTRPAKPRLTGSKAVCSVPTTPDTAMCFARVATTRAGKPFVSSDVSPDATPDGYGPLQFETAYNLPATAGVPQTIAIVDAYAQPNITGDLETYDNVMGLPLFPTCTSDAQTSCFLVLNEDGASAPLPVAKAGWGLEISMDVEVAHAICQDCRIELYEADSASFGSLEHAVNTAAAGGAQVISNSYGEPGDDCTPASTHNAYDHPHVAITVAAGDLGYERACPAVLSSVISVGGTTLRFTPSHTYGSESAWYDGGGGCSTTNEARPWQTSLGAWKKLACGGRGMNDVAADADPLTGAAVYDSFKKGGWNVVGGTSLSAPLIAGAYALAHNTSEWAFPGHSVYENRSGFRDVTTGSDGPCREHPVRCRAAVGYDLPTGVGTPNGLSGL